MQNQSPQIPDIENGCGRSPPENWIHRVNQQNMEDIEKMIQRIAKLETGVAKLNAFVDTSYSGACATFCASVVRLGLDILFIYVVVKVLS